MHEGLIRASRQGQPTAHIKGAGGSVLTKVSADLWDAIQGDVLGVRIERDGFFCHVDVETLRGAFVSTMTCSAKGGREIAGGRAVVDVRPASLTVVESAADADRE